MVGLRGPGSFPVGLGPLPLSTPWGHSLFGGRWCVPNIARGRRSHRYRDDGARRHVGCGVDRDLRGGRGDGCLGSLHQPALTSGSRWRLRGDRPGEANVRGSAGSASARHQEQPAPIRTTMTTATMSTCVPLNVTPRIVTASKPAMRGSPVVRLGLSNRTRPGQLRHEALHMTRNRVQLGLRPQLGGLVPMRAPGRFGCQRPSAEI